MILFETMKEIFQDAINDPDFNRKNTILQDPIIKTELQNRVAALRPTYDFHLTQDDTASVTGLLTTDFPNSQLFITSGNLAPALNQAVYNPFGKTTMAKLNGYYFFGTAPTGSVNVQWRRTSTDNWHNLPTLGASTPSLDLTTAQVNLTVAPLSSSATVTMLVILAEQI